MDSYRRPALGRAARMIGAMLGFNQMPHVHSETRRPKRGKLEPLSGRNLSVKRSAWPVRVTDYRRDPEVHARACAKRARKAEKRVRDRDRCAWGQLEHQKLRGLV
jgi:hypothetical protein